MATVLAFSPMTAPTVGLGVKVTANATPSSVSGSISAANSNASNILVTNNGTAMVFVRLSGEASPTATAADLPVLPNSQIVTPNPCQGSKVGIGVLSSTTTACDMYFYAGEGT